MADDFDGTEDLAVPIEVTRTADKVKLKTIHIDVNAKTMQIGFGKGTVADGTFIEQFNDSVTVRDVPEDGETPAVTDWSDFVGSKRMHNRLDAAAPARVGNGLALKDLFQWIVETKLAE